MNNNYRILVLLTLNTLFFFLHSMAQWNAPFPLSPNAVNANLNESMGSCLGVSGDSVHVVWTDKINSTHAILYYRHSLDTGLTWSAPIAITNATGNAWNPAIAVNGRNVHVAWREIDTVTNRRASWYKHSLDGGTTWSPSMFLDSTADWPAIAVSGSMVYIANDRVVSQNPYNTEIFFMRSLDNGNSWSIPQQLTDSVGRSEDESITAEGAHIFMSWNDNRTNQFQILYKESADYGATWGPDVVVDLPFDYNTMVNVNGSFVDVISCGAPSGHYQLLLAQSADTGATWSVMNNNLSHDTAHTFFLPHMTRDGCELHIVVNSSGGAKYFHSLDGGATWDLPYVMSGVSFIAYTYHVLHVIYVTSGRIYYLHNSTGNAGMPCITTEVMQPDNLHSIITIYPNPATSSITIHSPFSTLHSLLSIKNMMGQTVLNMILNDETTVIDISKFSKGIYFIETRNGAELIHQKIVIE